MNITIIDKSLRSESTINYKAVCIKLSADSKDETDGLKTIWVALSTFINGGALKIILDMSRMNYIDSQGVRTIFNAHRHLKNNNGDIALLNPAAKVLHIFETLNLSKVISVFENEEEAFAYLAI